MKIDNKFDPGLASVIEQSIRSNPLAKLGQQLQEYAKDSLAMKAQEYKLAAAARSLFGSGGERERSGGTRRGSRRRSSPGRKSIVPAASASLRGYNALVSAAKPKPQVSTPFHPTRNYYQVKSPDGSVVDLVEG